MKNLKLNFQKYSSYQLFALTLLRVSIGWHFLYEGLVKLFNPTWSSSYYLEGSTGPFSKIYLFIANDPSILELIDFLTICGLLFVGISLFLGLFTKPFKIIAIILLLSFYFSCPPFIGIESSIVTEGSYWLVNKNLIEAFALFVLLLFPSSNVTGIDRFLLKSKGPENE